ncbi:MAG TPA: SMP-30/gluconolactonase/LRE family protein [Chitinophagaceae bacterium]|nr:SMP-30/gluconolactonase/LRE family protein [Chitinophagaceae bacterium]
MNGLFKMRNLFTPMLFFACISCSSPSTNSFVITNEKDFFPEGITTNGRLIFISSITKNKIVQYDFNTKKTTDFIYSNQYGFSSGVGLFLKDSLLFALTNNKKPGLFIFNINNHTLIKKYQLNDNQTHFWNDLVISKENHIYITDSEQDEIFRIKYPDDSIQAFFQDSSAIKMPNGITLSEDDKKLFIASTTAGLRILDLKEKKIVNIPNDETKGIDGMKYFGNKIYAIVNISRDAQKHRLIKISLTKNNEAIERVDTLLKAHPLMNVPTTIDIKNNIIYILANSQMDNLNQEEMKAINKSILTDTYIIRLKIKNAN